jgi:Recombinase
VKLGGYRENTKFTAAARKAALVAKADKVAKRVADLAPVIAELRASGAASLRAIADGLNQRGIPTARGNAVWSATQVDRVLARAG